MKILKELKNDLLKRNEVEVVITQDKNPTKEEVTSAIANQFKASEDTIKIKGIKGNFGSHDFIITANIYNTGKDKETIEFKSKKEKEAEAKAKEEAAKASEEKSKAAEAPAAEEAPAEETKEEVKEESKE